MPGPEPAFSREQQDKTHPSMCRDPEAPVSSQLSSRGMRPDTNTRKRQRWKGAWCMLQPWGGCQPPVLGDDSGSRRNITASEVCVHKARCSPRAGSCCSGRQSRSPCANPSWLCCSASPAHRSVKPLCWEAPSSLGVNNRQHKYSPT